MTDPVIRVVLADDHQVLRDGLVALLDALPGMEVVGTAADGRDAVLTARETEPDVVVMDIQMPLLDGIEATRQVVAARPATAVVILTMNEDDDTIMGALRAGARGYLLKGSSAAEVQQAIRAAAAGGMVFGASLAARITDFLSGRPNTPDVPFPELTDREREVLDHLAAGRSNADIARLTHLSDKSVRNAVSSVYAKLHAADRADAIIKARDAGLGRD
ncbi:response regulator transcription factor [Phycicoccus sp. M110.8]|uniref:response regulator transcription factor n=1 Tax=Phycicoccus sp. M110.8 TaxID=3075433 RepID=UPI0028FD99F4|nr:response regulator transcription factor [Phycicoccus sp. M110.8]MDU0315746.1 response regulator transcription factor [Phycicoccus sp. M110.8]